MVTKITYLSPRVHYLTINGKFLTPNSSVFPSPTITGQLSTSTLTDWLATPGIRELAVNLTVSGSGSLSINFLILDPIESSNGITSAGNPPLASLPIASSLNGSAVVRLTVSRSGETTAWVNSTLTSLGSFPVPFKWQLQFNMSGAFGIVGTYEGRD